MKFLETLRKYFFWMFDALKGSKIRTHYRSIERVLNDAPSAKAVHQREKDLSAILNHAVATTEFYRDKIGFRSLDDFSVITKSVVREKIDSFISRNFEQPELIPVFTSGSTGTPFKVYHDRNKKLRNSADVIFFTQMAGYTLGDRLIYMKIFVGGKMKNRIGYWMENTIPVDVIRLNDEQIENLVRQMENDNSTYAIVGYSSALESVCKYLDNKKYGRVKSDVKTVIAISEALNDYTKETVQKYFSAPVISRYSNLENGIIAQQKIGGSGEYRINTASYVVEILKMDLDEPAEPGRTGRIVVTDLFNYGMPLIRYDTGDIGALSVDSRKTGNMYLSKVEGRKLDILYDTGGNVVSSFLFYKNMWQYNEIKQYQLIQGGPKEYVLKINIDGAFTREAAVINELKAYLGEDAIVAVDYVSDIPLLSSGKRRSVVNNYLKKPS